MENGTKEMTEVMAVEVTALQAITSGEIDTQISTAKKYPRSLQQFKQRATSMATLDEETAASCIYRRPVGKEQNGQMKYAEGKSIRLAEIVGAAYGNLRVGSMIIEQTDRQVKARGMAHDLETNFASASEVIESTVDKYGKPYSERMRVVVAKAALSKARRDATFQVVPSALCKSIEDAARKTAIGTTATLEKRRAAAMGWIAKCGVAQGRVFAALGIKGESDIGVEVLETLTGLKTAIKDGDTTVEDAFPAETRAVPSDPKEKTDKKEGKEK